VKPLTASVLVFLGSGLGGVSRYLLGSFFASRVAPSFPWPTLFINVIGSFLIGVFFGIQVPTPPVTPARLLVAIGILGGFTTFSSFSFETLQLIHKQQFVPAFVYVVGSAAAGLSVAALGYWIGSSLT
jgi:CrcB protein